MYLCENRKVHFKVVMKLYCYSHKNTQIFPETFTKGEIIYVRRKCKLHRLYRLSKCLTKYSHIITQIFPEISLKVKSSTCGESAHCTDCTDSVKLFNQIFAYKYTDFP